MTSDMESSDRSTPMASAKRRDRTRSLWRSSGVAVFVAATGLALVGCDGGTSSPHVAGLGTSSGKPSGDGSTTTSLATGDPTQLLTEWAACMRSHGDPEQVPPTVTATKVIEVTLPAGYASGLQGGTCGTYLSAAQTALGGGTPPASSNDATALKFAQCMRANGVPTYPDPTSDNQAIHASSGSDLNPANPTFQSAATLCTKKTGVASKFSAGASQPGSINSNMAGGFGGKP
jgi:hypothetical protein